MRYGAVYGGPRDATCEFYVETGGTDGASKGPGGPNLNRAAKMAAMNAGHEAFWAFHRLLGHFSALVVVSRALPSTSAFMGSPNISSILIRINFTVVTALQVGQRKRGLPVLGSGPLR